jgi:excisionase family DNA binding protein
MSRRTTELRDQKLLTKSAIARTYGVSRATVTNLISAGKLTPVRVGSYDRVSESDWLRHLETAGATALTH